MKRITCWLGILFISLFLAACLNCAKREQSRGTITSDQGTGDIPPGTDSVVVDTSTANP